MARVKTDNVQSPKITFFKLDERFEIPTAATALSAGLDVKAVGFKKIGDSQVHNSFFLQANDIVLCKTGFSLGIPPGYCAKLYARSGLSLKGISLANGVGIIDADYREEVLVPLINNFNCPYFLEAGHRVAQIMFEKVLDFRVFDSSSVEDKIVSTRVGGFGSTGV